MTLDVKGPRRVSICGGVWGRSLTAVFQANASAVVRDQLRCGARLGRCRWPGTPQSTLPRRHAARQSSSILPSPWRFGSNWRTLGSAILCNHLRPFHRERRRPLRSLWYSNESSRCIDHRDDHSIRDASLLQVRQVVCSQAEVGSGALNLCQHNVIADAHLN